VSTQTPGVIPTHSPRQPRKMPSLRWAGLLAAVLLPVATVSAQAQTPFPIKGKPITVVVPAPPGGPADFVARTVSDKLGTQWPGTTIVVENRGGGASIPAANQVRRATPDGHTVLISLNTTHTQVPYMFSEPPFDPVADFTPIVTIYEAQSVISAHPSLPANTLAEAVELGRRGTSIPAGSASPGTNSHLYLEILNANHGANFNHIPYKGAAPAVRDLVAGFTQMQFDSPSSAVPYIQDGRLKALGVTGRERMPQLPDVPTAVEQGFPELVAASWMGMFGPAGLAPETLSAWEDAMHQVLSDPEVVERFNNMGMTVVLEDSDDLAGRIRDDGALWGGVIRRLNLTLE